MTKILHLLDVDGREIDRYLIIIGQVIGVHIDDGYLTTGLSDIARTAPLACGGYRDYSSVTAVCQMLRPGETP